MQLKIDHLTFDCWDFRLADIERRGGVIVLLARHRDGRNEVLDAIATFDMQGVAIDCAEAGRLRQHEPGATVKLLTCATARAEASDIARTLLRQRWVYPVDMYPR